MSDPKPTLSEEAFAAHGDSLHPLVRRIVGVKTTVFRCGRGHWYCRLPNYADLDKGDQCEKCGVTSFYRRPGRTIGRKSKQWPHLIKELDEMVKLDVFCEAYPLESCVVLSPNIRISKPDNTP